MFGDLTDYVLGLLMCHQVDFSIWRDLASKKGRVASALFGKHSLSRVMGRNYCGLMSHLFEHMVGRADFEIARCFYIQLFNNAVINDH